MFKSHENVSCDVLVVGSGGAGLSAAVAAAEQGSDVLVVSKSRIGHASNTYLSKGAIASTGWGEDVDTPSVHSEDTLKGGRFLNEPERVAQFTRAIHSQTVKLAEWGVKFGHTPEGNMTVFKVPGHSFARHIHSTGWKGSDLVLPLKQKAKVEGVRFLEKVFISALLISDGRLCGAAGVSKDKRFFTINAKTVILATGGFGQVFLNTNNAPGITGDGHALAYNAGAVLKDMEFVQFYPTAFGKHGSRILLYENLLVQPGVVLKNQEGRDILEKNGGISPKEITRDQLARLVMQEILEDIDHQGKIYMDLEHLEKHTAQSLSMLLPAKWAQGVRSFQVAPTCHFCMGGITVDASGETACSGLFAVGEVTAGAHGANRLGGNALAEIFAMGALIGEKASQKAFERRKSIRPDLAADREKKRISAVSGSPKGNPVKTAVNRLKKNMWLNAGIVRDHQSLEGALNHIEKLKQTPVNISSPKDLFLNLELENMIFAAEMVCRAALKRTESRGAHFRTDYPDEDNRSWQKNIRIQKNGGSMSVE